MAYKYIDETEAYMLYDEMLNECYPEVFGILPARILSECDPIQYQCGFTDWLDSNELTIEQEDAA